MNIAGTANNLTVTYDIKHTEWKNESTVLSVDALSVTFCADGTISLKSKDGRLIVRDECFVVVQPGWYNPDSETTVNTKTPVFRNSVACCYEVVQKSNNRKGYIMSFKEKDPEDA